MSELSSTGVLNGELTPSQAISGNLTPTQTLGGDLISGVGAANNYNMLMNLPILNGVTIQGVKSSSDYGLPTVVFDTTENWAQCMDISEKNTIYVYTDYDKDSDGYDIAAFKVGDGTSYIVDLPFTDVLIREHINNTDIHVTAEEKEFWNNKNRSYAYGETLILTTS